MRNAYSIEALFDPPAPRGGSRIGDESPGALAGAPGAPAGAPGAPAGTGDVGGRNEPPVGDEPERSQFFEFPAAGASTKDPVAPSDGLATVDDRNGPDRTAEESTESARTAPSEPGAPPPSERGFIRPHAEENRVESSEGPSSEDDATGLLDAVGPPVVATLKRLTSPLEGQTFDLAAGTTTIGTRGTDIELDRELARAVSRCHARIEIRSTADGLAFVVEDLGSSNGTFLGGAKLERPGRLEHGSVIRFGNVEFQFSVSDPEALGHEATMVLDGLAEAAPVEPPSGAVVTRSLDELESDPVAARLRRTSGPHEGYEYELRAGRWLLGTDSPDIRFDPREDPATSRRHACIDVVPVTQGFEFFITDLGSSNGTFVDGERVERDERYELRDRDTIRLGKLTLEFREASETDDYDSVEDEGSSFEQAPSSPPRPQKPKRPRPIY